MSQSVIHGILYLIDPVKKTIFLTDHMTSKKIIPIVFYSLASPFI